MAGLSAAPHAPFDGARLARVLDDAEALKGAASDATWPLDFEQWRMWMSAEDCDGYFIREGGVDIGHFALFTRVPGTAHLSWLVLSRGAQGGRGRDVMAMIEELIRSRYGVTVMSLNVYSWNARAIHLYRACGFEVEGDTPEHVKMRKRLV